MIGGLQMLSGSGVRLCAGLVCGCLAALTQATGLPAATIAELQQRAADNDAGAQFDLFRIYRSGSANVVADRELAKRWLFAAGRNGHAEAQYWLGYIHFFGTGVPRDVQTGLDWYRKSAEQGFINAQFELGHILNGRRYKVVERDPAAAVIWYTRAAEQGYLQAELIMGCKTYYGIDVTRDRAAAEKWFVMARDRGDPQALLSFQQGDEQGLQEMCYRVDIVN
jgi:TPR repeat protein